MDQLCEFSWKAILSHLELKDHLAVLQVWPNILPLWAHAHRKFYHNHALDVLSFDQYQFLLNALHNIIEVLMIDSMNYTQEEIFKTFTFPNVYKLCITARAVAYSDRDILLLTMIIPNLWTIQLKHVWGPLTGRHFKNWRLLRNIALPKAGCLEVEYLREMMMLLPLETLELGNLGGELELLGYEIFSKLRKITICSFLMPWFLRGPIEKLINLKCFGIICYDQGGAEAISEFFHYLVRNCSWNLVKLTVENSSLATALICNYRFELLGLREIHLLTCHLNKYEFLDLILNFKYLRLLKIESCSFGFLFCRVSVASIVEGRTYPLIFLFDSLMYGTFNNLSTTRVQMHFEGSSSLFMADKYTFPPSI